MTNHEVETAALTDGELQRLADALYGRGRATGRYLRGPVRETVEQIIREREPRAAAAALRSAALSVPMGPKPDPANYLRECADVICPPAQPTVGTP